jgi:phosphoserine phosphatase
MGTKRYRLIVFDVDGTITRHISSWRYIHEKLGLWDVLARKYQEDFLAGRINYRKFCELDAEHWKGMKEKKLESVFKKVLYSKNAKKAIGLLKKEGYKLAAVSTGIQFMTDRVKKELGFDHVAGNRLDVRKGVLTGGVTINIGHGAKGTVVRKILKKFGYTPKEMIAIGDSAGDIPMLAMAGYSIAFNSTSDELNEISDWKCPTMDFMDVYRKIRELNG